MSKKSDAQFLKWYEEHKHLSLIAYRAVGGLRLAYEAGMKQKDADLRAALAERDEAVSNANKYRERVLELCDGMITEAEHTIAIEENRGLDPEERRQFVGAVNKMKSVFAGHDYLKEAKLSGSLRGVEERMTE